MSKVLVIGASRGIGREAVRALLQSGHEVRAFARHPEGLPDGAEPFAGDALNGSDLERALQGVDAVIVTLGIRAGLSMIWKPVTLFSEATALLLPRMHEAGVRRLIVVTGFGAGDSASRVSLAEKLPFRVALGQAYADKTRQEQLVRESGLDWTIVRPVILTSNKGTGKYQVLVRPESWRNGMISRADVGHFLAAQVEDRSLIGETPVIAR